MAISLDAADIVVVQSGGTVTPTAANTDDCDIWNNAGHDGGPGHGGDDFDPNDCG